MNIAIFGATGQVGSRIVAEALARGHRVTAIARHARSASSLPPLADVQQADASNVDDVVRLTRGHEVVVDATRSRTASTAEAVAVIEALTRGLGRTGARMLVVGGAGTLRVPGRASMALDDPTYVPPRSAPPPWRAPPSSTPAERRRPSIGPISALRPSSCRGSARARSA